MSLEFRKHPLYVDAKNRMEEEFSKKREEGILSKAHAEDHVIAVTNTGGVTAGALMRGQDYYDLAERAEALASVAGLMHDIIRESHEKSPHGPEGAKYVTGLFHSEENWRDLLGEDGLDAVSSSIGHHEKSFGEITYIFGSPIGNRQEITPSVVAHSLKTGDAALEASGNRVIERRSFFVGKERVLFGDLKEKLRYPDQSHLAFLGETMIRLYKKNPIDGYPGWLKPFAQEWHAIQYMAYKGLLKYVGMNEAEAANYMKEMGFTKFDDDLVEQVTAQRHLDGGHFAEDKYPVLSGEIRKLNEMGAGELDDLAESVYRVINLIARADSPEDAIKQYQREGFGDLVYAKRFMDGIVAYRNGSDDFLNHLSGSIEDSVRAIRK